jgi:hypothetical protein
MKVAFTFLTFALFAFACNDKTAKQTNFNKTKIQTNQQIILKGIWTIKRYYLSDISAMDEKMASEWLNKSLIIDDKLYFDFQKLASYKDIFKNENECNFRNIDKPEIVAVNKYFDTIRDPLSELKINKSTINIYKTTCNDNPFSEFVINENNEIIIRLDGAFFILIKE